MDGEVCRLVGIARYRTVWHGTVRYRNADRSILPLRGAMVVSHATAAARLPLKQNPAQFKSLISFGEVLDPASKAAVLSLDSQVQMQGTINNEFQVRAGPHHGKTSLIAEKGCVAVRSPSCNGSSLVYSSINS